MTNFIRQAAATSIAVMIASAFPLAQTRESLRLRRCLATTTRLLPEVCPRTSARRLHSRDQ